VNVESYNVELEDDEGFVGDRASKGAFRGIIERWRKPLRDLGHDPFGEVSTDAITKKRLDGLMAAGDPEAAGVVHGAIEEFAQELALVTRRFLKLKGWKDTERIVFGGGFSGSRVGELAIGRASVILKADKIKVEIVIIRSQPDEAGLLGAVHLHPRGYSRPMTPSWRSISVGPISAPVSYSSILNVRQICRKPKSASSNCGATATRSSTAMMPSRG
jgi:hypothetical protein